MREAIINWGTIEVLTWVFGFLGIGRIIKEVLTLNKRQTALLLEIGHYRLNRNCQKAINRGFRTVDETVDIKKLYAAYRALGGNGTGEELYNLFIQLPLKKQTNGKDDMDEN